MQMNSMGSFLPQRLPKTKQKKLSRLFNHPMNMPNKLFKARKLLVVHWKSRWYR